MKFTLLSLFFIALTTYANNTRYEGDMIHIDGEIKHQGPTDAELEHAKKELERQKQNIQLNKNKAKAYDQLQKTTEKLIETSDEMLNQKLEAQIQINQFNEKQKQYEARLKCLEENEYDKTKCPK